MLCFKGWTTCTVKLNLYFSFFSGSKAVTGTRRVRVTSKAKDCWNKVSWIILARVNLKEEIRDFVCSSCSVISHFVAWNLGKFVALLKETTKSRKKTSLLAGKICCVSKEIEKSRKKLSLLAGKLSLEKKGCDFEWCLVLSQKYTKSFGGKNLALCKMISPIEGPNICLISDKILFKSAELFFFSATLHSQKIVKEIAYILASYQAPFKSAIFFLHLCLLNKSKRW